MSTVLWRERQLLELLAFKLEEEQLVVAAGRPHLLTPATAEVEQVLEQVKVCESDRSRAVEEVAREAGLPGQPTLAELVDRLDDPWPGLMEDHRAALRSLAERIGSIAAGTRRLLASRVTSSTDALTLLGAAPSDYGRERAGAGAGAARGHLVQGSL